MTGLDILRDLISINTVNPPGNERAAAVYLRELLEPAGFLCEVQELGDGRANFLARLGTGAGPELMFNGHLDVVPAAGTWETNPFQLVETEGRVYGRGVCDMKGGVAAMCLAALHIAESGGLERGTLKLLFVADEEDANRGVRAYLREWEEAEEHVGTAATMTSGEETGDVTNEGAEKGAGEEAVRSKTGDMTANAEKSVWVDKDGRNGGREEKSPGNAVGIHSGERYAVIGEPTKLEVAVAHRGVTRSYVDIRGAARHAALPEDGNSSIEKLPGVLLAIAGMNRKLEERTHPVLPPPGISVTMVKAYEKDNVVPGKVRLLTDFRTLPGMDEVEAEGLLRNAIEEAGIRDVQIVNHFHMQGGEISPEDDFVKRCCEISGHVRQAVAEPKAFDASCEQCFLVEAGIKTVILGPGSLEQAHTKNEFLELEQLDQAVRIYEGLAREILGILGAGDRDDWDLRVEGSVCQRAAV